MGGNAATAQKTAFSRFSVWFRIRVVQDPGSSPNSLIPRELSYAMLVLKTTLASHIMQTAREKPVCAIKPMFTDFM